MIRLKVKEHMEARRLSMAKLSRMADLSYNTVQAVCKDPRHDVNVSTLEKIAEALHISFFDLVEEVEPSKEL